ncbi:ATP-dependent DNA ligase [Segetibacter aerophilus]|uniref:DNA ligase (ATP) n=1 Tax=Segetibacter aerophilus TaxID=670293 RepID=A0A512B7T9_9BACT|nr:ATP-dependent DNA ligase [Segetibacter aerophilus]GEO08024.1 ATP-dependent DNA ligase [Segetibacter aerophilus]
MSDFANDIEKLVVEDNERDHPSSSTGLGGFADLVRVLGTSTKTTDKLEALVQYFSEADDRDKVWVIALFSGRKPKRAVNTTQLITWCVEVAGLPGWLFGESYHTVGDLAETISLLLPETVTTNRSVETKPLHFYIDTFRHIEKQDETIKKEFILDSWKQMNQNERFVFNKLITGAFRIGVSQKMMVNSLAKFTSLEASVIAHRISGNWDPSTTTFAELLNESPTITDYSKPYPFYLAYALDEDPETLGDTAEWQVEWKWDGIRGQMIKRNNALFVWSRGEELMTDKFPEYHSLKDVLPDGTVLDGEIIPSIDKKPLPFALLQTRIGRKNVTKKNLQETPITFFAYDLLEYNHEDWRNRPLTERRKQLEILIEPLTTPTIILSPVVEFNKWDELTALRKTSREMGAEGFMIKRKSSIYQVGRKTGDWWKWKIEPLVIDCVMIYAEKGSGRRSNLYTAYTFAVRDGEKLVPFTRAYSGLTDKEFTEVDSFVKRNAIEKFGPVRTVKPELVFEIAFEGIAASNRHKSGVALRFPRINRWRKDKKADEINTLEDLKKMLEVYGK